MHYSNLKIILLHGNGGSTINDHWFPYVKTLLKKLRLNVISENLPDPFLARAEYWIPHINNKLKADKNTILIGHSTGAVAALRYAENFEIYGSVLVSANHTDLGDKHELESGYFDKPWSWQNIRNNQNWIAQFASIDDPYIPINEARHINKMTGSDYFEYSDQGHFGDDVDKQEFPELIQYIRYKLHI